MKKTISPLNGAQRILVEKNADFAMKIAGKFAGLGKCKGIAVEDLQQEACYGLCVAATHFDETQETSFQTYAYEWCFRYIMRAINAEQFSTDDDVERIELIEEDDHKEYLQILDHLMRLLNKKEQEVICLVYGIGGMEPIGFKEASDKLHIKVLRVQQIYQSAMVKLKEGSKDYKNIKNV